MDPATLEAKALSGELFNGPSRSSSPRRSPSPGAAELDEEPGWHDEEYREALEQRRQKALDYDSDDARREAIKAERIKELQQQREPLGMGPGRTGVKGVIRDRNEHVQLQREKKAKEVEELRKKMEATALTGKTYLEEEREKAAKGEKADELVIKEAQKQSRRDVWGRAKEGRFGHLREVGLKGFLDAVEKEDRNTWVVVHLYDSSLERCYILDDTLAKLARTFPDTKFLRAKAASLGFTSGPPGTQPISTTTRISKRPARIVEEDEDDPYGSDTESSRRDDDDSDDAGDNDNIDLDMLPTLLVYRGGELVHNWVRVDWEVKDWDVEGLLDKHHILPHRGAHHNLGLPSDDEGDDDFDLLWSDEDI